MTSKKISILGSTGSIGVSTLDIVSRHPDRFEVVALAAGGNLELIAQQAVTHRPRLITVKSEKDAVLLKEKIGSLKVDICHGTEGAIAVATHPDAQLVMSSIVGAAGLVPTLKAIKAGKTIALANKESMVIAGEIMRREAALAGVEIVPVDSEHSALFQCLQGNRMEDVSKLILTASGGPFLNRPSDTFQNITRAEALKHPNWAMGEKITIDSATMMNKGLEVMEARWLFDLPIEQIEVCVHPQSIIHSMVAYKDGSVMAQLGLPDMRVPIAYALSYPERIATGVGLPDLFLKKELTFFAPDFEKFPNLQLAFDVAKQGLTYPAVLNAANEVTVDAFLKEKISFQKIFEYNDRVLKSHKPFPLTSLEDVIEADRWGREEAGKLIL